MHDRLRPQLALAQDTGLSAGTGDRVIDPATSIGSVSLTVSDVGRSSGFYEQMIGLQASRQDESTVALAAPQSAPLLELHGDPAARPLDRRATGLFHLAILVPSRLELARSLWRLASQRWPLDGASDHLVSEALYLSDPDGNGIEIYRDRPRAEWTRSEGQIAISTLPLDLESILGELNGDGGGSSVPRGVAAGTRIGHIHLQVSDLQEAGDFYAGVLGFEVTNRGYPGALFVSAGGYHHHIAMNTWHSAGAKPPPAGSIGLRSYEVVLPDVRAFEETVSRVRAAGLEPQAVGSGALVHDPSGNAVVLRTR